MNLKNIKYYLIFTLILITLYNYQLSVIGFFLEESWFGTLKSPYSDALGPWLIGAIIYYLEEIPISYLYRPTIGIIYSSLISIFTHFYLIPYFILIYSSLFSLFIMIRSSIKLNLVIIFVYTYIILNENTILYHLSPQSLAPDFLAFSFTLIAIQSLISGILADKLDMIFLGLLHMGIALAIRGLQLPGLFIISLSLLISNIIQFNKSKNTKKFILIHLIIFISFIPFVIDLFLQKKFNIMNNGVVNIFCVYKSPVHQWNPQCHMDYINNNMAEKYVEIIDKYLSFIFSDDGKSLIEVQFSGWFLYDISKIFDKNSLILFSLISFFNIVRILKKGRILINLKFIKKYLTTIVIIFSLFLFYFSGMLLFVMLGSPGGHRTLTTLRPALYIAIFMILIPPIKFKDRLRYTYSRLGFGASIFILLLLYLGNTIIPKSFAREFNIIKKDSNIVYKLSNDYIKNLSLWFTSDGVLFYTIQDKINLGKILKYKQISCPNGFYNESYKVPCKIIFNENIDK